MDPGENGKFVLPDVSRPPPPLLPFVMESMNQQRVLMYQEHPGYPAHAGYPLSGFPVPMAAPAWTFQPHPNLMRHPAPPMFLQHPLGPPAPQVLALPPYQSPFLGSLRSSVVVTEVEEADEGDEETATSPAQPAPALTPAPEAASSNPRLNRAAATATATATTSVRTSARAHTKEKRHADDVGSSSQRVTRAASAAIVTADSAKAGPSATVTADYAKAGSSKEKQAQPLQNDDMGLGHLAEVVKRRKLSLQPVKKAPKKRVDKNAFESLEKMFIGNGKKAAAKQATGTAKKRSRGKKANAQYIDEEEEQDDENPDPKPAKKAAHRQASVVLSKIFGGKGKQQDNLEKEEEEEEDDPGAVEESAGSEDEEDDEDNSQGGPAQPALTNAKFSADEVVVISSDDDEALEETSRKEDSSAEVDYAADDYDWYPRLLSPEQPQDRKDYDCIFCHEDFVPGQSSRGVLDCGCNSFCFECIFDYFATKKICPLCEKEVVELDFEEVM